LSRFVISATGKKLLTLVLLFSSVITLIVTVVQLYVDFNNEVDHLDKRFHEINDVLTESLTASTWAFDQNQIQKQLKGILRFEQVAKVHLAVEGFRDFDFANNMTPNGPTKVLPLTYVDARGAHDIGQLTIVFTMEQIYGGLIQRGTIMLLSNFLKTLLVSFFILYIFNRLVTHPFRQLAARAREASIAQLGLMQMPELVKRDASGDHNEIEEMANSIALMHRNFQGSYQALKMSENRFRDIIADNFDYVFETNTSGEYTFVSSNAAERDPLKPLVVVGQSLFQLPLEEDLKEALKAQAKVQDYSLPFPNGQERHHYNFNINPVYDLDNRFVGYRGLLTEVTESVLAKERIEKQEDQIRHIQKVGLIGELAAGFAHDFNNILAIILGNVAILNRLTGGDHPAMTKSVTGIQSATLRGQNLIQRIMTFARRQGIDTKPVNLVSVLGSMSELIQVASSKRTKVNINSAEDLWDVRVDVSSFENVIINLCINARDAMPEGGDLNVTLSNKTLKENTDFAVAGDYVTVAVADNGVGIPLEMREKIFEPFFTTKEEGQGTGLGLSTVLNFVQQSYGAVTVESKVNEGTTFTIYLPRYQGTPA
jgi:signal transduction histidine kinase